jgi:hypothetical protein
MKRGSTRSLVMASRTNSRLSAAPTRVLSNATTISLTWPLKSGTSSAMRASPLESSFTTPENSDAILIGTASSPAPPPPSPPLRSWPMKSARGSISLP